ncbi:MAG: hypothetical protein R2770_00740 [Acidimicrobiales bacterium]
MIDRSSVSRSEWAEPELSYGDLDPWGLELETGATCIFSGGATGMAGNDRVNYFCDDGTAVLGLPDKTPASWTVLTSMLDGDGVWLPLLVVRAWV